MRGVDNPKLYNMAQAQTLPPLLGHQYHSHNLRPLGLELTYPGPNQDGRGIWSGMAYHSIFKL